MEQNKISEKNLREVRDGTINLACDITFREMVG